MHTADPILVRLLELRLQLADLAPRFEIVVGPLAVFDLNHLGQPPQQQHKCPTHVDDVNRDILTIEQQDAGIQS